MQILIALGLILAAVVPHHPDHYRSQIFFGLLLISAGFSVYMIKKIHWSAAIIFLWMMFSGLMVFLWPVSPFHGLNRGYVAQFDANSTQAVLFLLSVATAIMFLKKEYIESTLKTFSFIAFISSCWMIVNQIRGYVPVTGSPPGILDNSALDACFIAMCYPMMNYKPTRSESYAERNGFILFTDALSVFIPIVAIILSRSNTALFALGVGFIANQWRSIGSRKMSALPLLLTTLAAILYMGESKLLADAGRVSVWRVVLAYWEKHFSKWTGSGFGTFQILGPNAQLIAEPKSPSVFIFAHNEYLQTYLETGIIGAVLAACMIYFLFKKTMRDPWLFATLASISVVASTQMIFRFTLPALFSALMIRVAFERGK